MSVSFSRHMIFLSVIVSPQAQKVRPDDKPRRKCHLSGVTVEMIASSVMWLSLADWLRGIFILDHCPWYLHHLCYTSDNSSKMVYFSIWVSFYFHTNWPWLKKTMSCFVETNAIGTLNFDIVNDTQPKHRPLSSLTQKYTLTCELLDAFWEFMFIYLSTYILLVF